MAVLWFAQPCIPLVLKQRMPFQIRNRKLTNLHTNERNPRSIKDHKFQKLLSNLQAFPKMLQIRPIVVDETGKILGGNMRYQAAKHLGWTEVPTINAEELTEDERKAFIILDNQDFGEWNFEVLSSDFDADQLIQYGFEAAELGISLDDPKFVANGAETDEGLEVGDEADFETSHVKMVQLFLNTKNYPEFIQMVESLQEKYQTDNITDTVFKAIKYAYNNGQEEV